MFNSSATIEKSIANFLSNWANCNYSIVNNYIKYWQSLVALLFPLHWFYFLFVVEITARNLTRLKSFLRTSGLKLSGYTSDASLPTSALHSIGWRVSLMVCQFYHSVKINTIVMIRDISEFVIIVAVVLVTFLVKDSIQQVCINLKTKSVSSFTRITTKLFF